MSTSRDPAVASAAVPSAPARGLILAAGEIDLAEESVVGGRRKLRIGVASRSILIAFASEEDVKRALREGRAEFGWGHNAEVTASGATRE